MKMPLLPIECSGQLVNFSLMYTSIHLFIPPAPWSGTEQTQLLSSSGCSSSQLSQEGSGRPVPRIPNLQGGERRMLFSHFTDEKTKRERCLAQRHTRSRLSQESRGQRGKTGGKEGAGRGGRGGEACGALAGISMGRAEMLPTPDWAHLAFLPPEGWGLDLGV